MWLYSAAMSRPVTAVLLLALLGIHAGVTAQAPGRARVSVDWRRVSDADVERCGLSKLRAGTIERLVDDGHAVVDAIGEDGIAVAVGSEAGGLRLVVQGGAVSREQLLHAGASCDATFVLDVISRIAELVGEVARALPPRLQVEPEVEPAPEPEPAERSEQPAAFVATIDAAARSSYAPSLLIGGGIGARARLSQAVQLGLRAELLGNGRLGVTLLEGFLGAALLWQPSEPAGLYLELGPLVHAASSERRSVTELDAALGVGLQLSFGRVVGQLLLHARLRRFEHVVDQEKAFDTGYLGLMLRIGGQLLGS
jgi:hypothetical protein